MFRTGVVVGKFLPVHAGHLLLLETAARQCTRLTVFVCRKPGEEPSADRRAGWLRELLPAIEVRVVDDLYDPGDSGLWARLTIGWLGYAPEVCFTSEAYGPPWAAAMGAVHISVDRPRRAFPVSGTAVRADPQATWDYLPAPVRAFYARRFVVLGAESTGTTTLTEALAETYGTVWVPEYGREYYVEKDRRGERGAWQSAEFTHIAEEQARREDMAARVCNRLLFCDTDPFATTIWHERYLGFRSAALERFADERRGLYERWIVTAPDISFVQDGFRDGEHVREAMHGRFVEALEESGRPFDVVEGSVAERVAAVRRNVS